MVYRLVAFLVLASLFIGLSAPVGVTAAIDVPNAVTTDGFGYTIADENIPWIDANGGTLLTFPSLDDAYVGPLNIGFNFRFYEQTFSTLYVSTNGMVSFGSGSLAYRNKPIPWPPTPNNFIAPLWSDLKMHNGRAYVRTFGTAPARTYVIEWEIYDRTPSDPSAVLILNFEVILYENTADIVFQYNALSGIPAKYSVGIEDSDGVNGLQYLPALVVGNDIRFVRPAPGPRVKVLPRFQGSFVYDKKARYQVSLENNGEFGTDIYNLRVGSSSPGWQAKFYDRSGERLLTDTNSDTLVDTGSINQGGAITVTLKVDAPSTALPGDYTTLVFTATSSLSSSSFMTGTVQTAVPVQFSQIYVDGGRGIRMGQYWEENVIDRNVLDTYRGATLSMEAVSDNNYLATWEDLGQGSFTDIRYKIFNRLSGAGPEMLLTNGAEVIQEPGVTLADARVPTIAAAPDGRIAMAWSLLKWRPLPPPSFENEKNSNIYFAILNAAGNRISDRFNVTDDAGWFVSGHTYEYPNLAITGDSRYIICWIEQFAAGRGVRCAVHTFNGSQINQITTVQVDTAATNALALNNLSMAALSNNRTLVTYTEALTDTTKVLYAVVNSAGALVSGPTEVVGANGIQPRAVQFANGNTLLCWIEQDGRVAYTYLDSSFVAGATQYFSHLSRRSADSLSVTLEREGQAVITWVDLDDQDYLFYAVLNQTGGIRTPVMIFISNPWGDPLYQTSAYGFGNSGYLGVYQVSQPYISR